MASFVARRETIWSGLPSLTDTHTYGHRQSGEGFFLHDFRLSPNYLSSVPPRGQTSGNFWSAGVVVNSLAGNTQNTPKQLITSLQSKYQWH